MKALWQEIIYDGMAANAKITKKKSQLWLLVCKKKVSCYPTVYELGLWGHSGLPSEVGPGLASQCGLCHHIWSHALRGPQPWCSGWIACCSSQDFHGCKPVGQVERLLIGPFYLPGPANGLKQASWKQLVVPSSRHHQLFPSAALHAWHHKHFSLHGCGDGETPWECSHWASMLLLVVHMRHWLKT